jgi:hypothetical protein
VKQKPTDLLEFLRQSSEEERPVAAPIAPQGERTVSMLVLRRSQVIVALVVAGLFCLLVFLLGLGLGGGGEPEGLAPLKSSVWGIRLVTYKDTDSGRAEARATQKLLRTMDLDEVTLQRIASKRQIVVMLGSWLSDPENLAGARQMLSKVQKLTVRGKNRAFPDAHFWSIQR